MGDAVFAFSQAMIGTEDSFARLPHRPDGGRL